MALAVSVLKQQIEKAKENLKNVDDSIKKVTGRDPNEKRFPADEHVRPGRGRGGTVRLGRRSLDDNHASMEEQPGPPPAKRAGGVFRRIGSATSGIGGDRRVIIPNIRHSHRTQQPDSDYEDDEPVSRPTVQSSVVSTAKSHTKTELIHAQNVDEKGKARNRRMFGMLLGTLARFQSDESKADLATKQEQRRTEIEKRLEETTAAERRKAAAERRELFNERRAQQRRIMLLEQKILLAGELEEWEAEWEKKSKFIITKASPPIFFMPKDTTGRTIRALQESRKRIKEKMATSRSSMQKTIESIDAEIEALDAMKQRMIENEDLTPKKMTIDKQKNEEPADDLLQEPNVDINVESGDDDNEAEAKDEQDGDDNATEMQQEGEDDSNMQQEGDEDSTEMQQEKGDNDEKSQLKEKEDDVEMQQEDNDDGAEMSKVDEGNNDPNIPKEGSDDDKNVLPEYHDDESGDITAIQTLEEVQKPAAVCKKVEEESTVPEDNFPAINKAEDGTEKVQENLKPEANENLGSATSPSNHQLNGVDKSDIGQAEKMEEETSAEKAPVEKDMEKNSSESSSSDSGSESGSSGEEQQEESTEKQSPKVEAKVKADKEVTEKKHAPTKVSQAPAVKQDVSSHSKSSKRNSRSKERGTRGKKERSSSSNSSSPEPVHRSRSNRRPSRGSPHRPRGGSGRRRRSRSSSSSSSSSRSRSPARSKNRRRDSDRRRRRSSSRNRRSRRSPPRSSRRR
uniref:Pinin n=1 Tax=Phallusia mammillata TaxID=59560 RepID=A0A6F9DPL9_9ASCI|nr:pinin-like [Phallusia mammillata]